MSGYSDGIVLWMTDNEISKMEKHMGWVVKENNEMKLPGHWFLQKCLAVPFLYE